MLIVFPNSSPVSCLSQQQELISVQLPGRILTPVSHFSFHPDYKWTWPVFSIPCQLMWHNQSITLVSSSSCLLSSSICCVKDVFPRDSWLISDSFSSSCLINSPATRFNQKNVRWWNDKVPAKIKVPLIQFYREKELTVIVADLLWSFLQVLTFRHSTRIVFFRVVFSFLFVCFFSCLILGFCFWTANTLIC